MISTIINGILHKYNLIFDTVNELTMQYLENNIRPTTLLSLQKVIIGKIQLCI